MVELIISSILMVAAVGFAYSDQVEKSQAEIASTLLVPPLDSRQYSAQQVAMYTAAAKAAVSFRVAEDSQGEPVVALAIPAYLATDAVLERLGAFSDLEELNLVENGGFAGGGSCKVTDSGLAHLVKLKHLRSLFLPSDELTDVGVAHLGEMIQLQELRIGNGGYKIAPRRGREAAGNIVANITDAGIKHLNRLRDLRSLSLTGTQVTDEGLGGLKELTQLRSLNLVFLDGGITERSLAYLGQFQRLESLYISDMIGFTHPLGESLSNLTLVPNLQTLRIFSLRVNDTNLSQLNGLTQLKTLELYHAIAPMPVTDAGLEHLKGFTSLRSLTLGINKVTDKGLGAIANLKHLELIDLKPSTQAEITDQGLLQLRALPALKELRFYQGIQNDGLKVTEKGIAALTKELPGLKIVRDLR